MVGLNGDTPVTIAACVIRCVSASSCVCQLIVIRFVLRTCGMRWLPRLTGSLAEESCNCLFQSQINKIVTIALHQHDKPSREEQLRCKQSFVSPREDEDINEVTLRWHCIPR
jgi:hypothetical protein